MSLSEQYQRQFLWREWDRILSLCPIEKDQKILDLGCSIGDISNEIAKRGGIVTGVDSNVELLKIAQERNIQNSEFIKADLSAIPTHFNSYFDGIWCSYASAYFTDVTSILTYWSTLLKPNGWICLVEINDLLNHEPLPIEYRRKIEKFYEKAFSLRRYDFCSGSKLEEALLQSNYFLVHKSIIEDKELNFQGPVSSSEILEAWKLRLQRITLREQFTDSEYNEFIKTFLDCIQLESHRCNCEVVVIIARKR